MPLSRKMSRDEIWTRLCEILGLPPSPTPKHEPVVALTNEDVDILLDLLPEEPHD